MAGDIELRQRWEARRGQFADDVAVSRSTLARMLWVGIGLAAVALGVVGIFLPVLPTTPFMILAAACFARSSARFYNALLSHRVFGPTIYQWRESRTIPPRAKAIAIALMVITFGVSIAFFVPSLPAKLAMGSVGLAVVVWLLTVPGRPR